MSRHNSTEDLNDLQKNNDKNVEIQDKCSLCGKTLSRGEKKHSPNLEETTTDGIRYTFDTADCMSMFKRLKSAYGTKFGEFLGIEQYVSDPFWDTVIPSEQEIKEIEEQERIKTEFIQVMHEPSEIQELGVKLVKSAQDEILIIFSTANAFHRQIRVGGFQLLKMVRDNNSRVKIRISTPFDKDITQTAKKLRDELLIDIRDIKESFRIKSTIVIVDRKFALYVELKDDTKDNSNEAMGLAIYSSSRSTVLSYVTIFESIWKQGELHEQLSYLQEQIKTQQERKKQLIAKVSELRIPIVPILALAEAIRSKKSNQNLEQEEFLDVITRNAKKLELLTHDIMNSY